MSTADKNKVETNHTNRDSDTRRREAKTQRKKFVARVSQHYFSCIFSAILMLCVLSICQAIGKVFFLLNILLCNLNRERAWFVLFLTLWIFKWLQTPWITVDENTLKTESDFWHFTMNEFVLLENKSRRFIWNDSRCSFVQLKRITLDVRPLTAGNRVYTKP